MEVILTHENTDFDALASLLAAAKLYPKAYPVVPNRPNRNVRDFLTLYMDALPFVRQEDLPRRPIERVILVDTQSAPQLRGTRAEAEVVIIDHHLPGKDLGPRVSFRGETTGATTTLLLEELCALNYRPTPVEATLLLLGIYEDTGSLSYATTTPRDIRCAAWLLEQGANLQVVNDFLHHPLTEPQRRLYEQLVGNAQSMTIAGHPVTIATARVDEYVEEISTLAHKLRDLFDPDVLFVLVKLDSRIQMVARSSTDALDVAEVTREFGGGGHARAAAALITDHDLEQVRERLMSLLNRHIKPLVTVRQIMSHGAVRTLPPDATVAEAAEMMRRYGHEGFPVVEGGRLVGIVRRREIDRAMTHNLGGAAISTYMHKGAIYVSPDDSVQHLQQVMMEYGVGQVPVMENGLIIGIVTRTDLIKLWSQPPQPVRAAQIAERLTQVIPQAQMDLIQKAIAAADELGYGLYLVGGFVRDLLLGVPSGADMDLVVEGDAIVLAKKLAEAHGGRVHSHTRFGTAKWIVQRDLALDFVTARTEFYERPTALPTVERGSIKSDLGRRDFTINTMAINLSRDRYGELLDYFGGEQDLERGLVRVLHSLSFVEDPTRILRAVRLEQRLSFRIEERTEELIDDALDLLDRVSGERIRNELYLIFQEAEPARSLARLGELGVLRKIHPALQWDDWLERKFASLPERVQSWSELVREPRPGAPVPRSAKAARWGLKPRRPSTIPYPLTPVHYLALLAYRLTPEATDQLIARLKIPGEQAALVRQLLALRQVEEKLAAPDLPNSAIYRLLYPYPREVRALLWVATDDEAVRQRLALYETQLEGIEPTLTGNDLKAMGIPPGPIYRVVLSALQDARLDGRVRTREDEEALAREILKQHGVLTKF